MTRRALSKLQVTIVAAVILCAAVIGFSAWWFAWRKLVPPPLGPGERTRSVIKVEAEGIVLHYQNESFWGEDQFSEILEHKAEFDSSLIKQFREGLSRYGLRATCYEIWFDESRRSTLLTCDVHGAVSKRGDRHTAEFEWLLQPLELNLYDFKESYKELFCETTVDGTPITITLGFPATIDHCYYHVWWETKE